MARDLADRRLPLGVSHDATHWTLRSGLPYGGLETGAGKMRDAHIPEPTVRILYTPIIDRVSRRLVFLTVARSGPGFHEWKERAWSRCDEGTQTPARECQVSELRGAPEDHIDAFSEKLPNT
jgi:hypothetical protein